MVRYFGGDRVWEREVYLHRSYSAGVARLSSIFTFDLVHLLARHFGTDPLAVGLAPDMDIGPVALFDPSRGDDPWVKFAQVIVPTSEHRYTYGNRHESVYMSGFWNLLSFACESDLVATVVEDRLYYPWTFGVESREEVLSKTMDRIRFLFEVTNVDFSKFPVEIRGEGESAFLWHPNPATTVWFTRVRDSFPAVPGEPRYAGTNELARNLIEFLIYESGCFGKPGRSIRFESG